MIDMGSIDLSGRLHTLVQSAEFEAFEFFCAHMCSEHSIYQVLMQYSILMYCTAGSNAFDPHVAKVCQRC